MTCRLVIILIAGQFIFDIVVVANLCVERMKSFYAIPSLLANDSQYVEVAKLAI